ncbi:MAG: WD40 repeat domain-containing protein [Anaerolineae bacterium]|nr:WD40 repeat domain-containing protein [Anaerolineae bacterium]
MQVNLPSLPDQTNVYIVRPYFRVIAYIAAGFLLLFMPAIAVYMVYTKPTGLLFDGAEYTFVFINLLMLTMATFVCVSLIGTRLTISPDGIEFNTFGYTVASPWENIIGYGYPSTDKRGVQEGLVLERALTSAWIVRNRSLLNPVFLIITIVSSRYMPSVPGSELLMVIPVEMFDKNWQRGEIGEQMRRYAPHLFHTPAGTIIPAPARPSPERLAEIERTPLPQPPCHAPGVWATLWAALRTYPGVALATLGVLAAAILLWGIVFQQVSSFLVGANATWREHTESVNSLAISTDGRLLVSGSDDGTVRLWNTETGQSHALPSEDLGDVQAVALSPDGSTIASSSRSGPASEPEQQPGIRLWDVATEVQISRLTGQDDTINALAFSPNGKFLASASGFGARSTEYRDYSVWLWDVAGHTRVFALTDLAEPAQALAFSPNGTTLAVGLDNGEIILIDLATYTTVETLEANGRYDSLEALAFTPSGQHLLYISFGGQVVLWDVDKHERIYRHSGEPKQSLYALAMSPDGAYFVVGGSEQIATLWDTATGMQLKILRGHAGDVESLVFSPDGTIIYSGSSDVYRREDNSIKVWAVR